MQNQSNVLTLCIQIRDITMKKADKILVAVGLIVFVLIPILRLTFNF